MVSQFNNTTFLLPFFAVCTDPYNYVVLYTPTLHISIFKWAFTKCYSSHLRLFTSPLPISLLQEHLRYQGQLSVMVLCLSCCPVWTALDQRATCFNAGIPQTLLVVQRSQMLQEWSAKVTSFIHMHVILLVYTVIQDIGLDHMTVTMSFYNWFWLIIICH